MQMGRSFEEVSACKCWEDEDERTWYILVDSRIYLIATRMQQALSESRWTVNAPLQNAT